MDQFNSDDFVEVGFIQKLHGLKGDLILSFNSEFEDRIDQLDTLFIQLDGGLVPFFLANDGFRPRSSQSAICHFDWIDTQDKAKGLVGCTAFIPDDQQFENMPDESESPLIGMIAIDDQYGELGEIDRVDDFAGNIVITVNHPKGEILIPLSDEIITSVDEHKRVIHLNCPKGLIDIYLE